MHTDCRHCRTDQPCTPHKRTGVRCDRCTHYDPIGERILIVKLGAMGDVLRTTTCLPPLKARYPRSHITWVTRGNAVPLLEGNPAIDRILSIDGHYLELLLVEEFDLAFGPDADLLSASIMAAARSQTKQGFVADGRGGIRASNSSADGWWRLGLDDDLKRANRRTYGDWLYGICGLPTPVARPDLHVSPQAAGRARVFLRQQLPHVNRWIGFNTGASSRWEEKRWKPAYYAQLARLIVEADPAARILLLGGPDETELNGELMAAHPAFVDGGTMQTVEDFAALVASCEWMLTGDSLAYHVACAVGTPALCLVGPTSPWELDAYGDNKIIHAPLLCIACYLAKCVLPTSCMEMLTPDWVWQQILEWRRQPVPTRSTTSEPAEC